MANILLFIFALAVGGLAINQHGSEAVSSIVLSQMDGNPFEMFCK